MSADPENWYPLHDSEDIDFTKIMTPTPRTDEERSKAFAVVRQVDPDDVEEAYDFARQLERELEEAKKTGHACFQSAVKRECELKEVINDLKEDVRRADVMLAAHKDALEKARVALEQHIMRCNWSRHGYGPCTCPHDTRIKEALTAINELNQEPKP